MAVTPVYVLDVPPPYDELVLFGEKALSVAPTIDGAAPRTNYIMSAWADLEGGEYFFRVLVEQVSSWATSITKDNRRVFFYTKKDAGPHTATIFLPRGRQRIDILLSNLLTTNGPCYVAFSLFRQGKLVYSTADGNPWVFDTTLIADEDVPPFDNDERLSFPVFSVLPDWSHGVLERITYSTEVLTSESETEQRRSLRVNHRRSFEASFPRHTSTRSRIDAFLAGQGKNKGLLPIWHEQYVLTSTLGASLSFPAGTLVLREFRAGGMCLVSGKDPRNYEVLFVETATLESDSIIFEDPPVKTWPAGSRVFPLRIARVIEQSTMESPTDTVGVTQIRFQLDEEEAPWFDASWGAAEQFFGFPIDRGINISVKYDRPTAIVTDGDFGPVDVYDADQRSRLTLSAGLQLKGRAQALAFRQFIEMTRGRALRFLVPTFMSDLQPVGDEIDGIEFIVKSIGFAHYFRTTQIFRYVLAFELRSSGAVLYRTIETVEDVDGLLERVVLTEEIPTIAVNDIRRLSYLMTVRFDQDTFELQHVVDQSRVIRASVVFTTLGPTESVVLGGGDNILTSLIYPLEVIEEMDAGGTFRAGSILEPLDQLDVSGTFLGGVLTTTIAFKSITADPESLDVSGTFLGGVLTTTIAFKSITADPESLDVSGTFLGGTLETAIIFVSHVDPADDEGLNVSGTFLGGTLA